MGRSRSHYNDSSATPEIIGHNATPTSGMFPSDTAEFSEPVAVPHKSAARCREGDDNCARSAWFHLYFFLDYRISRIIRVALSRMKETSTRDRFIRVRAQLHVSREEGSHMPEESSSKHP